jgi:hypothetical protein
MHRELIFPIETFIILPKELMIPIDTFNKCMSKELIMPIETFKNMQMLIKKRQSLYRFWDSKEIVKNE